MKSFAPVSFLSLAFGTIAISAVAQNNVPPEVRSSLVSTDLGMALITLLISELWHRRIVVPVLPVLERLTIAA